MRIYDVIDKKRRGVELTNEEIQFFIDGYMSGAVSDYQAAALIMAICINGMTEKETTALTMSMANSGEKADMSVFGELSVDKHSTGGVGDKTSLIVAPIVASLGCKVAKMSGRGLGHTGGTVDKLESIPGYKIALSTADFFAQVNELGMAIVGQSGNFAPADKKLYALRDVTATVESIPLISSSIMSKKLAAGAKSIVLDVKFGRGAFMHTPEEAEILASNMVRIGRNCGRRMSAVITDMNSPLGYAIGNSLEVKEAIDVLRGESYGDLREICIVLASEMIALVKNISYEESRALVSEAIDSGKAYEKMKEWIAVQGGDVSYIVDSSLFPESSIKVNVYAEKTGYIVSLDAQKIGFISVMLGAGRLLKDDPIDYSAGIMMKKKTGDFVREGEIIAVLHTNKHDAVNDAVKEYLSAVTIIGRQTSLAKSPLVYKTIR